MECFFGKTVILLLLICEYTCVSQPTQTDILLGSNPTCNVSSCVDWQETTCIAGVLDNHTCTGGQKCCQQCGYNCQEVDKWFVENKDGFCLGVGGQCKHNSNFCNGTYTQGICGGKTSRQCCVPPGRFSLSIYHFTTHTILTIVAAIINSVVVIVTILDKDLHTIPNTGICSLALGDLLLSLFWFSIQVIAFIHQRLITDVNPNLRTLNDLAYVCETSVILHIFFITIERFIAILYPLKHWNLCKSDTISKTKIVAICLLIWILSTGLAYSRRLSGEWSSCGISIFLNSLRSLFPLLATAVLNVFILKTINNRISPGSNTNTCSTAFIQNTKAARTVGLIVISLLIAFVPLRIITITVVCGQFNGLYEVLSPFIVTTKLLNSIINPLIYAVTTDRFKYSCTKNFLGVKNIISSSTSKSTSIS